MLNKKIIPIKAVKKKRGICPQCGTMSKHPYVPFCSRRCAQIDLGKWFNEYYSIPSLEHEED